MEGLKGMFAIEILRLLIHKCSEWSGIAGGCLPKTSVVFSMSRSLQLVKYWSSFWEMESAK